MSERIQAHRRGNALNHLSFFGIWPEEKTGATPESTGRKRRAVVREEHYEKKDDDSRGVLLEREKEELQSC